MGTPDSSSSLSVWLDWLLSRHPSEIDLGLERVGKVANAMGLQQLPCPVISVAGTNGKGSSVAMLSSIYQTAGLNVGTYTSPHLVAFNERVRMNGEQVSDQSLVEAFHAIECTREQLSLTLTFFEVATLAALYLFKQAPLDLVVLEVGLGGRLDAVNLVDADAALITAIGIDHVEWLGNDREAIAAEKAGIMRSNRLAVCSDNDIPVSLNDYAHALGANLLRLGSEFGFEENDQAWWIFHSNVSDITKEGGASSVSFPYPNLPGDYQVQNAAGVVALVESLGLRQPKLAVEDQTIAKGLTSVFHPGRLQSVQWEGHQWWVDVAHNPQAANALSGFLKKTHFKGASVFAVLADKDALPMIQAMKPYIGEWFLPNLNVERALAPETVRTRLMELGVKPDRIHVYDSMTMCLDAAKAQNIPDWIVWGSLYTVGQFLSGISTSDCAA